MRRRRRDYQLDLPMFIEPEVQNAHRATNLGGYRSIECQPASVSSGQILAAVPRTSQLVLPLSRVDHFVEECETRDRPMPEESEARRSTSLSSRQKAVVASVAWSSQIQPIGDLPVLSSEGA